MTLFFFCIGVLVHRMHRMHRMHNHFRFFLLFYIVLYYIYIFCLFYLLKNRTNSIFGAVLFFQMVFMDKYSLKMHHMHFSLFYNCLFYLSKIRIYELNFSLFYLSKIRTNSIFDAVPLLLQTNLIHRYSRKMHHMHFSLFYNCLFYLLKILVYMN